MIVLHSKIYLNCTFSSLLCGCYSSAVSEFTIWWEWKVRCNFCFTYTQEISFIPKCSALNVQRLHFSIMVGEWTQFFVWNCVIIDRVIYNYHKECTYVYFLRRSLGNTSFLSFNYRGSTHLCFYKLLCLEFQFSRCCLHPFFICQKIIR